MKKYIETYVEIRRKIKAYQFVSFLFSWDQETEAPKDASVFHQKQFAVIAEEAYKWSSDPSYIEAVKTLYNNLDKLDEELQIEIKEQNKNLRIIEKVPKDEYIEFQILTKGASIIWSKAKETNDFSYFAPTLEKIVLFQQKLVKYLETDELKGYDILLDLFEEGMTQKEYDNFFNTLRSNLVPFVMEKTAREREINNNLINLKFEKAQQKAFSEYLLDVFYFDRNKGLLKESVHPFTSSAATTDTRLTTKYDEDNISSAIFSTIHELGHAIYEMQNDSKYDDTFLQGGTSLGFHESQSRMYENMIARQEAFWDVHYNKLVELFPKQLNSVSKADFLKYINNPKRSLIRIEADELTYSLHIMVRYELEKLLLTGQLKVNDLPKKWNELMQEYLGVTPDSDSKGVLQDIHWSGGMMGYFPTYALGSAYAAQIYYYMDKEIDCMKQIKANKIDNINNWLKEHVHKFGKTKTPKEIMLIATKKAFNPNYYIKYLIEKYQNI